MSEGKEITSLKEGLPPLSLLWQGIFSLFFVIFYELLLLLDKFANLEFI